MGKNGGQETLFVLYKGHALLTHFKWTFYILYVQLSSSILHQIPCLAVTVRQNLVQATKPYCWETTTGTTIPSVLSLTLCLQSLSECNFHSHQSFYPPCSSFNITFFPLTQLADFLVIFGSVNSFRSNKELCKGLLLRQYHESSFVLRLSATNWCSVGQNKHRVIYCWCVWIHPEGRKYKRQVQWEWELHKGRVAVGSLFISDTTCVFSLCSFWCKASLAVN